MSLDWDTTNMVDCEVNFPPDSRGLMNDDLHVIIWGCMTTGIGNITEKNYVEWHARYDMWSRIIGPQFQRLSADPDVPPEPYYLDLETVKNAIGLLTNVGMETRASFMKRFWSTFDLKQLARTDKAS